MVEPLLAFAAAQTPAQPRYPSQRYTFLAATIRNNVILGELPLYDVTASLVLNGAGSFSAKLFMGNASPALRQVYEDATDPARTMIYIVRDNTILGGWMVWKQPDRSLSANGVISLQGATLESWLDHVPIWTDLNFAQVDQTQIAAELAAQAQNQWGDIQIAIPPVAPSGVKRDRTYLGTDAKPFGEALKELSAVIDGFDYAIDCRFDSTGLPERVFTVSYPRRGRTDALTLHYTDDGTGQFRGNILDYSEPRDGERVATYVVAYGSGEGDTKLLAVAPNADLLQVYPPLVRRVEYSTVTRLSTLQIHANTEAALSRSPVIPSEVTVLADADPILGSYIVGDDAHVLIDPHPSFPAGIDRAARVTGIEIDPTASGPETVKLTVGEVVE